MGIIGLDIVGTQVNCSFCIFWFFLAEIEFFLSFSISSQLICGVQITNIYLRSTGQVSFTRQLPTLFAKMYIMNSAICNQRCLSDGNFLFDTSKQFICVFNLMLLCENEL